MWPFQRIQNYHRSFFELDKVSLSRLCVLPVLTIVAWLGQFSFDSVQTRVPDYADFGYLLLLLQVSLSLCQ